MVLLYIYYIVYYTSGKTSGLKVQIIYDHPTKKIQTRKRYTPVLFSTVT